MNVKKTSEHCYGVNLDLRKGDGVTACDIYFGRWHVEGLQTLPTSEISGGRFKYI